MDGYGLYKHARDAAWRALIDFQVTSLPVSPASAAGRLSIPCVPYPRVLPELAEFSLQYLIRGASGLSVCIDGRWIICYDPATVQSGRARFTVAHELNHILSGHNPAIDTGRVQVLSRYNAGDMSDGLRDPAEREADMFSARFLAPACVLRALGAFTPEAIMRLCGISRRAAEIRAERMILLRERDEWMRHPLERRVYEQFLPFIEAQRH